MDYSLIEYFVTLAIEKMDKISRYSREIIEVEYKRNRYRISLYDQAVNYWWVVIVVK